MKNTFLILILVLPVSVLANQVDGGFGFKFKEKIDITELTLIKQTELEGIQYKFNPEKPYGKLNNYYVYLTTTTNTVYKIEATGSFKTKDGCKQELGALEEALENKYGKKQSDLSAAISGMPIIRFGGSGKRIVGFCMEYVQPYELTLTYVDDDQIEIAKSERASIINSKRDLSGL